MENTTYVTGETRVLSAMTAARVRAAWPQTQVNPAPLSFPLDGDACVQMMTLVGHAGATNDRGFAIDTFPTRSGPPCRPA
jgi:hypothetical protein